MGLKPAENMDFPNAVVAGELDFNYSKVGLFSPLTLCSLPAKFSFCALLARGGV